MANLINKIILDGHTYNIYAPHGGSPKYQRTPTPLIDVSRGGTGLPIITESGITAWDYTVGLICTLADLAALDVSLAKRSTTGTPPQDELDLIDAEGNHYNPNASGDGTLNTGAFFFSRSAVQPIGGFGWINANKYEVTIKLLVNAAS